MRSFCLVLVCSLLLLFVCGEVVDAALKDDGEDNSGPCGTNLTWEFSGDNLTIKGSGEMDDYSNSSSVPWAKYQSFIRVVLIGPDVASLGN